MAKVSTNISLDADLKASSQGLPFAVSREVPNSETAAALNEYAAMKAHPEKYPRYASFHDAINEVLTDA